MVRMGGASLQMDDVGKQEDAREKGKKGERNASAEYKVFGMLKTAREGGRDRCLGSGAAKNKQYEVERWTWYRGYSCAARKSKRSGVQEN
jgi:hypothetical protein